MRKFYAFLFSLIIVFSLVIPVEAASNDASDVMTRSELIQIANAVFPEYSDNFTVSAADIKMSRSSYDPVVIEETRTTSDGATLTYIEKASGLAFLNFYDSWDETSSSTSGSTKTVTGVFTVTCNTSPDLFYISDMSYQIDYNGYDRFLDEGDCSTFTTCDYYYQDGKKMNETSSGAAYIRYNVTFSPSDYAAFVPASCRVTFRVGGDNFTYTTEG